MKDWRDYMLSIDSPFRLNVHPAPCTPISYIQSSDSEHKLIALHAPIIILIMMSEYKCCFFCKLFENAIGLCTTNKPIEIE